MMDEASYLQLVDKTFRKLSDAFDDIDPDVADFTHAGDVITIKCRDGLRCVINTQRPTRQVWMAAGTHAWHFSYDEATKRWLDDKLHVDELFSSVQKVLQEHASVTVEF